MSRLSDDFDTSRHSDAQAVQNVMMVHEANLVLGGNDQNMTVALRDKIEAPTLGGCLTPVAV